MSGESIKAADVMTGTVHTLDDEMDVREAIVEFQELGISGAPVVDNMGRLVGVLSQTDVVNYYLSRDDELRSETDFYQYANLGAREWGRSFEVIDTNVARVKDIMSPVTIAVTEDDSVHDIARLMMGKQIHRVVVTRGDKVTGIVSALDLLKAFFREGPDS